MKRTSSQKTPAIPDCFSLTLRIFCLLALTLAGSGVRAEDFEDCEPVRDQKRIVIIIDDVGHNLKRGRAAVDLPGKLNFAVIPYTPHGVELAERAHKSGKEVLLHAPMSTLGNDPLSRGGLTAEMDRDEFRTTLAGALEQVPYIKGVNNHMGSDLTERRQQMAWVMQELRWRELYFVDSRTSENTVAAQVAKEFNVPNLSRDVFLDNDRSPEQIDERFQALLARAERDGLAIAIGHPYAETIAYLEEELLTVHDRGFRPVFVSEVVEGDAPGCESEAEDTSAAPDATTTTGTETNLVVPAEAAVRR